MCSDFVKPLLLWYNTHGRDLPWRKTKDPYRIWVSEIMLQQTRVEAVLGYYERFLGTLPDIDALANCPEDELYKLWEGLGYYSRVRNMQKAARMIRERYFGKIPEEKSELIKLPGIGDYTAGAVASIAFGRSEPAVDGNIIRIASRLYMLKTDFSSVKEKRNLTESLRKLILPANENWGALNQAFMDLGAGVCLPNAAPICEKCPVSEFCCAHKEGVELNFPVRSQKKTRRILNMTVMLIRNGDKLAVRKRPESGLLSGLYEFPNTEGLLDEEKTVKLAESITSSEALRIKRIPDAKHIFSHVEWHMRGYEIIMSPDESAEHESGIIYADAHEIERLYPIPSAFSAFAEYLNIQIGKKQRGNSEV